jgi:hypothetical protein
LRSRSPRPQHNRILCLPYPHLIQKAVSQTCQPRRCHLRRQEPYQHRPWVEPLEASQITEKAQAITGFKAMKSWQQYPPKPFAPPPSLSFKELCSNYPNHLNSELLFEMSGARLKPRDIVEMMPADTRNPDLGTEWSWVAERTKSARWAREGRRGAVSQSVSAKFEESSRPTGESIFVKVGGQVSLQSLWQTLFIRPLHKFQIVDQPQSPTSSPQLRPISLPARLRQRL